MPLTEVQYCLWLKSTDVILKSSEAVAELNLSKLPRPPPLPQIWTTFFSANVPKNLSRGFPLPPHPQIDPIYTVCENRTNNLGRALPSFGQNPKEQLLFSGDLPQEHPRC